VPSEHHQSLAATTPLALPAVSTPALATAAESWSKSGAYYYRAIARMHKLWAASAAPHKDVSLAECATAQRCCEHLLLQLRRQRAGLGQVRVGLLRCLTPHCGRSHRHAVCVCLLGWVGEWLILEVMCVKCVQVFKPCL